MRSRTDTYYDSLSYRDVPYREARERLAKASVPIMAMRILGEPVRFRGYRGSREDEEEKEQEFRLGGKTLFYKKGEGWTDAQGGKVDSVADRERMSNRYNVQQKIDDLLKDRFPSSYDLLDTIRQDSSLTTSSHLEQVRKRLATRLQVLPLRQLRMLVPPGEKIDENTSREEILSHIEETLLEDVMMRVSAGRKTRSASELYVIGSFLKGEPLVQSDTSKLEKLMKGKKILVLGDDVGTLSEVLRSFGVKAYGIEINNTHVRFAHSGLFAENSKPQKQVIQGDATRLISPITEVSHFARSKGPFDIVYSNYVLFGVWWKKVFPALDAIVKAGGYNIHQIGDGGVVTNCDESLNEISDLLKVTAGNTRGIPGQKSKSTFGDSNYLRNLLEKEYRSVTENYAATSNRWIIMRAGVEQRAASFLSKLRGEHRTKADWYRGKRTK